MAVDQHKIIVELKRKLLDADSLEAKDKLIEEMSAQLDRNERFLKESDTCIQQLESDLSHLLTENQVLKTRSSSAGSDTPAEATPMLPDNSEEMDLLRGLVSSFTEQSRDMLAAIAVLEEDNRRLMSQSSDKPAGNVEELSSRLAQSQKELLKVQTQYLELEERYLELKMQQTS
jgi:chromosome segregation ATPase